MTVTIDEGTPEFFRSMRPAVETSKETGLWRILAMITASSNPALTIATTSAFAMTAPELACG
jgi:hypothetical protein